MFPTGQPPYPPMGQFQGFQQAASPQGIMRSIAPYFNTGGRGLGGFGFPGFSGNAGAGAQGFFGAGSGFGTQALGAAGNAANAGGAGWLGHMQTALKAMQSAAPMVQQYGPMLKNIPAMINMMKIMNEPDEEETSTAGEDKESIPVDWESSSRKSSKQIKKSSQGTSQPKLYV